VMRFIESPYLLPLLLCALISLLVGLYAWARRTTTSAIALSLLSLAIAVWSLGYALEIAGADLSTKLFWGKLQYFGIATAPLFWLIFAFNHANQGNRLTHRRMLLLFTIPAITIGLALTTEFHGLIWTKFAIGSYSTFSALEVSHGWWFWIHTAYSYLLLAVGSSLVFRSIGRMKGLYRGQTVTLIMALLAPWIGNALYLSGFSPIPSLDPTPFAFTITVIGLAWGIFGFQLVDVSPMARELIVENMREGMIILDTRQRIADINPAAARMIGMPISQALGKPIDEILSPWPHLAERFRDKAEAAEVITIGHGEAQRRYGINLSSLQDQRGQTIGRLITVRDIDEVALPEPRFAVHPELSPLSHDLSDKPEDVSADNGNPVWNWLVNFFVPSLKQDLEVPPNTNPLWVKMLERTFTAMMRSTALLATIGLIFAILNLETDLIKLVLGVIVGLFWWMGLARQMPFRYRNGILLSLLYVLSLTQAVNFGYSVEAYVYFLALIILATLLDELRGGLIALGLSLLTLGILIWQIGIGNYLPPALSPETTFSVSNIQTGMVSLANFAAISLGLIVAIISVLRSVNVAWQKETQALNLLQQERDLLEQRVTERTRDLAIARDNAIRQSNELRKYFLAMEQSGNTIVITDTDGKIEYANPKFEALTGYSRTETLGNNPRVLKSGEHNAAFYKNLWDTISAGAIWHGELHNRRKNGSLFWESATIAPLVNAEGQITNYIAIKEDISAEKELQAQLLEQNEALTREVKARQRTTLLLQESEARFRQIVENASDLIYRTDIHGCFTYTNPTVLRLMHCEDDSAMLGKHYLELAQPSARHKLKRFYDHQYLARTPATYYEFPIMTQDGREIWLGQNVQLITDGDEILGFQAVAREITEIKQAHEALSISRDRALEASRLKGQLLSRVSHELRTPLGAILGYAELLAMNTFGDLNAGQQDAAHQIMDSADYLSKMVNDLLDQAQVESKKMSLHRHAFSPAALLNKIQTSMGILAGNKGLTLNTSLDPELPEMLYEDDRRLQQILINLTGNAIKFTQTGQVEIKIYPATPAHWAIQVSDTGAGIPKEAQAYIFEPFRQVDNSITRENRGSGLGLSITKQLVELMEGTIRLESEPGRGSCFTITLPIVPQVEPTLH
jgi:PAS domain S-box-containing protein